MAGFAARIARRRRRELSCQELVEIVSAYLDGELAPRDVRRVERHLAACDGCERYIEQMRVTRGLLGEVRVDGLDPAALAELRTAFRGYRRRRG